MWDPEQLAEIPVLVDRLLASGDPLGEWLAVRGRLDAAPDELDGSGDELGAERQPGERQRLRRRARALRDQLGARLRLAEDPGLGPALAIRERGMLVDVTLADARPESLSRLLARPDAALILRLRLAGEPVAVCGCVEVLASVRHLRELAIERSTPSDAGTWLGLGEALRRRAAELARALPDLYALILDDRSVLLPFTAAVLDRQGPWSRARRTALGRALASRDPELRRRALERLREHGPAAVQLRSRLLAVIEDDDDPGVREAALGVIGELGGAAVAVLALLADIAERRDDDRLRAWLASVGG